MKQITVIAEHHPDVIGQIAKTLGDAEVNIETIDSEALSGSTVAILTVDRYDIAIYALARAGFHAVTEDALLVQLDDRPGALAGVTERFEHAGIAIRSIRFIRRSGGTGFVAISTARTSEAKALVDDILIA